jgi:polyribonucleotide nucleotidyltransferase
MAQFGFCRTCGHYKISSEARVCPHCGQPDPCTPLDLHVGQVVEGRITRIIPIGIFVSLPGGFEGMLHRSQIRNPGGTPVDLPNDSFNINDSIVVSICHIDSNGRVSLEMPG